MKRARKSALIQERRPRWTCSLASIQPMAGPYMRSTTRGEERTCFFDAPCRPTRTIEGNGAARPFSMITAMAPQLRVHARRYDRQAHWLRAWAASPKVGWAPVAAGPHLPRPPQARAAIYGLGRRWTAVSWYVLRTTATILRSQTRETGPGAPENRLSVQGRRAPCSAGSPVPHSPPARGPGAGGACWWVQSECDPTIEYMVVPVPDFGMMN
jgi:hypothetical protein